MNQRIGQYGLLPYGAPDQGIPAELNEQIDACNAKYPNPNALNYLFLPLIPSTVAKRRKAKAKRAQCVAAARDDYDTQEAEATARKKAAHKKTKQKHKRQRRKRRAEQPPVSPWIVVAGVAVLGGVAYVWTRNS